MVAVSPLILGEDLKISSKIIGGNLSKKLFFGGGAKFKGGGGGGAMNPNDVMVVVLKDILLCLLGFMFIYIVYVS